MNTLRAESAEMRRTLDSLREERRQARETISKQQVEIQTLKSLPQELAAGPRDAGAIQRMKMLEKMLQVREEEKAELQEQLRAIEGGQHASTIQPRNLPRSRPPRTEHSVNSGVPLFNSRTDDILQTAAAGFVCAGIVYGAALLQGGVKGGILGLAVVVGCIFTGLFGLLTLFKAFLWIMGGGDEKETQYQPIEAMQPVVEHAPLLKTPGLESVRIQQPEEDEIRDSARSASRPTSWTGVKRRDYNSVSSSYRSAA
mmetsp:Transcript_48110/g.75137  ORF Transcript_48110/g.75137 Transcript_48110/m.75137 type:complete len:256 (+) Transcript_48110:114-881(+)